MWNVQKIWNMQNVWNIMCREVMKLLHVGLHRRVPFIEDLSGTVQVVW